MITDVPGGVINLLLKLLHIHCYYYSLRLLKYQYNRLGLKRRGPQPSLRHVRQVIRVSILIMIAV